MKTPGKPAGNILMKLKSGNGTLVRRAAAAVIFACLLCSCCLAEPLRNVTMILLSNTSGLPESDRALTRALDTVAAMKLETLPNLGLIRESEAEMYMAPGDFEKLWNGDRSAVAELHEKLYANVIAIGRHRSSGKWKTSSEYRVYYVPPDEVVRTAQVKFDVSASGTGDMQRKVVESLAGRLPPVELAAGFWKGLGLTDSDKAFQLFGEGLENISSGREDAGLAALGRAEKEDPGFRDLQFYLGKYYATAQYNYERSLYYLKTIIENNPDDCSVRYWLGFVYRLKGEYAPAVREFEKVSKIKPAQYDIHLHLAELYSDLGDFDKAVASYKSALEIAPQLVSVWYSLACLQSLMGDTKGALASLRRALELNAEIFHGIASSDADLKALRELSGFHELMEEMKP